MPIIKKLIKWVISIIVLLSTGYYIVTKFILHKTNFFTNFVDKIFSFLEKCLIFIAQHFIAILIVVAVFIILQIVYKIIISKNGGDKE